MPLRFSPTAQYPLIYGLSDTTSESQRVATSIADWTGSNLDTTSSVCHGPSGMGVQGVGEVTCTLGEVRNRGDLIIFWGANPAESHPRHFTRYSSDAQRHVHSQRAEGPYVRGRRCPQDQDCQDGRHVSADQTAFRFRSSVDIACSGVRSGPRPGRSLNEQRANRCDAGKT